MFKYLFGSGLLCSGAVGWLVFAPVTEANVNSRLYAFCYYYKAAGALSKPNIDLDCGCWIEGITQRRSKSLNAESLEYLRQSVIEGGKGGKDFSLTAYRFRKVGNLMKALVAQNSSCGTI